MAKFYGVKQGYKPGVYTSWAECQEQVKGFKGALYKSFGSEEDAKEFVYGDTDNAQTNNGLSETDIENLTWELYGIREGLKERDIPFILNKIDTIAEILNIELEKHNINDYIKEVRQPEIKF